MKPLKDLIDRYFFLLPKEVYSPEYGERKIEKKYIYNEEISRELDELEKEIYGHPDYQGRAGNQV